MIHTSPTLSKRQCGLAVCLLAALALAATSAQEQAARPWLRSRQARTQAQPATGTALEVPAAAPQAASVPQSRASNRSARTADIFANGDGYNIFVTNTCEREAMKINVKTSKPFHGVIHTKNFRARPGCSVTGEGETEFNLEISNILNATEPNHCGVVRAPRESAEDKDLLSVIVAVRFHRMINLADDKFFLLNCTNRCRKPDCSNPSAKLTSPDKASGNLGRLPEEENAGEVEGAPRNPGQTDECTIWRFPWLITLLWCMGILLVAMLISHCIICSSMVCKCVKTEVEETEPSIYEGATDNEDSSYNKRHPYRIEYDNRDVYKTTNNYQPYTLDADEVRSRQKHERRRK